MAEFSTAEITIHQSLLADLSFPDRHEEGVVDVVDFFPRPKNSAIISKSLRQMPFRETDWVQDELKRWLVRRVECIRGTVELNVEIYPAFDYARAEHTTMTWQRPNSGLPLKIHQQTMLLFRHMLFNSNDEVEEQLLNSSLGVLSTPSGHYLTTEARTMVTTPEKWDSITRKWADYIAELRTVKLFLIDEVHMLKESRGATLEGVVSRMNFKCPRE